MTELNEEWVQSVIKLGLIESKKTILHGLGSNAFLVHHLKDDAENSDVLWLLDSLNRYAEIDALLRDDKATAKLASEVVKASRK